MPYLLAIAFILSILSCHRNIYSNTKISDYNTIVGFEKPGNQLNYVQRTVKGQNLVFYLYDRTDTRDSILSEIKVKVGEYFVVVSLDGNQRVAAIYEQLRDTTMYEIILNKQYVDSLNNNRDSILNYYEKKFEN